MALSAFSAQIVDRIVHVLRTNLEPQFKYVNVSIQSMVPLFLNWCLLFLDLLNAFSRQTPGRGKPRWLLRRGDGEKKRAAKCRKEN